MELISIAKYNSILSTPEKLSVYLILYYASTEKEKLDTQTIIKKINKKYGCEISYNKTKSILDIFVEENIVNKSISGGIHKYYLANKIYIPSSSTPLPFYQVLIFVSSFVFLYYSFYINNENLILISLSSFVTVLLIVFLHQLLFEISREELKVKILKWARVWKVKSKKIA